MIFSLLLFIAHHANSMRSEFCERIECAANPSEDNLCLVSEASSECEGSKSCSSASFFIYKPKKGMTCTYENLSTSEYLSGEIAKPVENINFEYYRNESECGCKISKETLGCVQANSKNYCKAGFYCQNFQQGDSCIQASPYLGCKDDLQCPAGYGCNEKECVELFSIGIGGTASDSKFCRSNWTQNGVCDSISVYTYTGNDKPGTKFSPIKSDRKIFPNYECDIGQWCLYSYSSQLEIFDIQLCQCGASSDKTKKGYCSHHTTAAYKHIEDIVSNNLRYKVSNCTGPYAHSADLEILHRCGSIDNGKYENFTKEWNKLKFFAVVRDFIKEGYDFSRCPKEFSASIYFTTFTVLFLLTI